MKCYLLNAPERVKRRVASAAAWSAQRKRNGIVFQTGAERIQVLRSKRLFLQILHGLRAPCAVNGRACLTEPQPKHGYRGAAAA
jgi:hypothetical protein